MERRADNAPPANWQDFEDLCLKLWRPKLVDAKKNGRSGQPQAGVDICGRDPKIEAWIGIQCKQKGRWPPKVLTIRQIKDEVRKAAKFRPPLSQFIIATTAQRDVKNQEFVRRLGYWRRKAGNFSVDLFAWEDIQDLRHELRPLRDQIAAARPPETESGLLGAWLKKVVKDHERLVPYFRQGTELTFLDRVYVKLKLADRQPAVDKDVLGLRYGAEDEVETRGQGPWSIRDLLGLDPAEHNWVTRRWMILGHPGAGKTTLLRHLAATVARQNPPPWIPVFESLSRLMREPEWLLDRIGRQMMRAGEPAEGLPAVLNRAGQEGRLLLLLDGLDEIGNERRDEAEALMRQLSARWPKAPLVVTSRQIGYQRFDRDFQELELLPLDGKGRREFLARWFGRKTGKPDSVRAERAAVALDWDPGLRDLASNPLYLTLIALLIEQGTVPEPQRVGLFDQVFELLLDGGYKYPKGEPMEAQEAVRRVLSHLAYSMTRDNRDAEPVTALEGRLYKAAADTLREPLERVPRWRRSMRPFLEDLAERTGILGPHDGPNTDWRYWHRTFREALAAEALEDRLRAKDGKALVLEHARQIDAEDLSRWAEPYALLVGRVEEPDDLVLALVNKNRALGLRAVATAQGLRDETLREILKLTGGWEERAKVYERLPELIDDPLRVLALLDQIRKRTRHGNDLFFLEQAVTAVGEKWPDAQRAAGQQQDRLYDHIPAPSAELFSWIETPNGGRGPLWREIPAGRFFMGSIEGTGYLPTVPPHEVLVRSPYQMAAVPVTVAQYAAFDPEHRSYYHGKVPEDELSSHPVERVTWYQAFAFCRWLSASFSRAAGARLPTEEEWEYACRAGTQSRFWSGSHKADADRVGWYISNSDHTQPVGSRPANPWHLYDMHGNVWEWTISETTDYSGRGACVEADPLTVAPEDRAASVDTERVVRGGSIWNEPNNARAAVRATRDPRSEGGDLGFRVCLPALSDLDARAR